MCEMHNSFVMNFGVFKYVVFALIVCNINCQSTLLNPLYYNIAPCPCDLTVGLCDYGCCCDTECTTELKKLFPCFNGTFGGNYTVDNVRNCSTEAHSLELPDYHSLTCVFLENYNAFLGYFYTEQSVQTSLAAVSTSIEANPSNYSLYATNVSSLVETVSGTTSNTTSGQYKVGFALLARPPSSSSISDTSDANHRIALPQPVLDSGASQCDSNLPVRFLMDFSVSCDIVVTSTTCSATSRLEPNNYLRHCSDPNACAYQQVKLTRLSSTEVGNTTVIYYNYANANGFDKSSTSTAANPATQDSVNTLSSSPSISGSTCTNLIVEVRYEFYWQGVSNAVQIPNVIAHVYRVPSVSLGSTVTQKFSTHWSKLGSGSTFSKSGYVGYEADRRVLIGTLQSSPSRIVLDNVKASLRNADSSGICSDTSRSYILFGQHLMTTCAVSVQLSEFADCNGLRASMKAELDKQFDQNLYFGIYGDSDPTNITEWVQMIRSEFVNHTNVTDVTNQCMNVTTGIRLIIVYAEQGRAQGLAIYQIVGIRLEYYFTNLTFICPTCSQPYLLNSMSTVVLNTNVKFYQVPANWSTNMNAGIYNSAGICWWGICWDDLLYPISNSMEEDSLQYRLAFFCMLLGVFVFVMTICRPWW